MVSKSPSRSRGEGSIYRSDYTRSGSGGACVATPVAIFVADCTHQAILLIDDVTTFSIGAPSSVLSYVGSEYDLDVG